MGRLIVIQEVNSFVAHVWVDGKPHEEMTTPAVPGYVYHVGQMFRHEKGEYLLAAAPFSHAHRVVMINMSSGLMFTAAGPVENHIEITAAEFAQICAGKPEEFTLIEEGEK